MAERKLPWILIAIGTSILVALVIVQTFTLSGKDEQIEAQEAQIEQLTEEAASARSATAEQLSQAQNACNVAFGEANYVIEELHRGFYAWAETAVEWSEFASGGRYSVPVKDPVLDEVQRNLDAVGWGEDYISAAVACLEDLESTSTAS